VFTNIYDNISDKLLIQTEKQNYSDSRLLSYKKGKSNLSIFTSHKMTRKLNIDTIRTKFLFVYFHLFIIIYLNPKKIL
jgi:hypothetical protein